MEKTIAQVGMKVIVGRKNGQKTLGVITKINRIAAKVKILENRGNHSDVGAIWNVPYSMMTPAENTTKSHQTITKPQSSIVPNQTTFSAAYADSISKWKVIRSLGARVWLCEIVANSNEEEYTDWVGTQKSFLTEEILASISTEEMFCKSINENDAFFEKQTLGNILHYHNGFNQWVRCKVIERNGSKVLLPIALVGDWKPHDLPVRRQDGSIFYGYHAESIINGKTFIPNISCIFECGCKSKKSDPSQLQPISLTVPEMTPEQTRIANLWKRIGEIQNIISDNQNPEYVLDEIRKLVCF